MKKILIIVLISCLFFNIAKAQETTFSSSKINIKLLKSTSKVTFQENFDATIINLEVPSPSGDSYKSFLMNQKIKSKKQFPYKYNNKKFKKKSENLKQTASTLKPIVTKSYGMMRHNSSNHLVPIYGGLPNDNSSAISNDGLLLLSINSTLYLYDTKNDSILYPNESMSLRNVFDLSFGSYFDPKIIYDNTADRFVLVFLKNSNPASSKILVGFSKTNNPIDGWNVYTLPGNPLNNNRWTDFPTIALSDSSLFFSGNLIIPNVSWQVGFDGSILWEMNKFKGYNASTDIDANIFYDIKFEDKFVRNLHCVQGADGNVEKLHLLSNRNFDIQNDTFFIASLVKDNDIDIIKVAAIVSTIEYGVPPNGRQSDTDTSDATMGLQTNDARVLGAIQFEDEIQFVSTSINTETGFSSIYHGIISNLYENPEIEAHIIADDIKDFGYPNIAWTGNEDCDRETIIAFNHTSFTDSAGISALYYSNERNYSDVIELKKGTGLVDRLPTGYERWGDYFGLQRKYNEPGKVFSFGFTVDETDRNYGWVNEIVSPDTNTIGYTYELLSDENYCNKYIEITAFGGVAPYKVEWQNDEENESLRSAYYCNGDTISFTVLDSRSCNVSGEIFIKTKDIHNPFALFPNPTSDLLAFQFYLEEASKIDVTIIDYKGDLVKNILYQDVKKGLNELYFSTKPLAKGIYFVEIKNGKEVLSKEKFLKK